MLLSRERERRGSNQQVEYEPAWRQSPGRFCVRIDVNARLDESFCLGQVLAVLCWEEMDHPALGGWHQAVTYGTLVRKVEALVQAQEGGPVDATVDGWLRSTGGASVLIADRIAFHT
jgi:hypothetical protein